MTLTAAIASSVGLDRCLTDVRAFIRRYVVLSDHQATTIPLWIAHTHAFAACDCTPYLQISSATKRAGKTRTLEVMEPLVARPWFTGRTSAAALVRNVDGKTPTLLLDESDATFGGEKEYAEALRGVLNTGYRRSGKASICVGQGTNVSVKDFKTFCPKAISGIGQLPDTVADRAIPIELRRRTVDEACDRWRERDGRPQATPLRDALAATVLPLVDALRAARPVFPEGLSDRQCDCWEPLLALADVAGGAWPRLAREAATSLSGEVIDNDAAIELLSDIRAIVQEQSATVITTEDLIAKLVLLSDKPWATWRKGEKPITGRGLARLLGPLKIHSDLHSTPAGRARGYRRDAFDDAFARYLPIQVFMCSNANNDGPELPILHVSDDLPATHAKTPETSIDTSERTHEHIDPGVRGSGDERLRF